ncbi:oligopeptide/dipeptide ABC transporter ATP-binding protein [Antarcticirhabdus aurantiaca]|uniref:ATP-binding cassette domain-containing protein n=1 Tax=Antarcticirhabdus aurantiaca TaxID=2606717 RepID=A0ACD4NKJ9_9HYPH|nr:oligopeptide/dipeptide ABC transporter ATP-binding protein [Antarcticirhabdus aurantiaca]WAJ27323.1 ATP-binding cassette domain-containing protein [Jeongeuplla avenae]
MSAVLQARALAKRFGGGRSLPFAPPRRAIHALRGVDLDLVASETLGIVGESGCGKSTLARLLAGLDSPSEGSVRAADGGDGRGGAVQYVFQDPAASLNPRLTVGRAIEAPLRHRLGLPAGERQRRLPELMDAVGLGPDALERYPHEFSGGQAQRIAIARALAAEPRTLVLDEPVSALDVSIQAQVLKLLRGLQDERGLAYVFITHDLSVVEAIADRIAVMYFGRVVEESPARAIFAAPRHPYTRLLLDSAPVPGRRLAGSRADAGELPDPANPPPGCAFASRCPRVQADCRERQPDLDAAGGGAHRAACFHPLA